MNPQKVAKRPMSRMRYRIYMNMYRGLRELILEKMSSLKWHRPRPTKKRMEPWPMSPNITPNRNGNVTH